jgi:RsiW-degrading membrane proteinase PrsW (M82 family)
MILLTLPPTLQPIAGGLELFSTLFSTVVWGFVPPIAVLLLYFRRVPATPKLAAIVALFSLGVLAGLCARGLDMVFWVLLQQIRELSIKLPIGLPWANFAAPFNSSTAGLIWHKIGVLTLLAEACKLAAVALPLMLLMRRYRRLPAQPSTVLLATFAVGLGFAAQENTLDIWQNQRVLVDRTIGLLMPAIFSAPWGLALGFALCRTLRHVRYSQRLVMQAWITACLVHVCSSSWQYVIQMPQMSALVTPMFSWWLWLWWQTERMLRRSQDEAAPQLIQSGKLWPRLRQFVLAAMMFGLGGAAINGLRNFGNSTMLVWELRSTFDGPTAIFLGRELAQMLVLGTLAIGLFRYLHDRAIDRAIQDSP